LARATSWLLIGLGAFALLDAGITMVWQEPLSALYATVQQHELAGDLNALDEAPVVGEEAHELSLLHRSKARIALLARDLEHSAAEGSAVGRIEIPRIGADYVLVNGTSTAALERGPGIYSGATYPGRSFPGLKGTTAIAGHRTTFLAPFRHVNELRRGDTIILTMPYGQFTYRVKRRRIVLPSDVGAAIKAVRHQRLVLSACTPAFSATHRLLVVGRLVHVTPLGEALTYRERVLAQWELHSQLAHRVGLPDGGLKQIV
jgi:sortase A